MRDITKPCSLSLHGDILEKACIMGLNYTLRLIFFENSCRFPSPQDEEVNENSSWSWTKIWKECSLPMLATPRKNWRKHSTSKTRGYSLPNRERTWKKWWLNSNKNSTTPEWPSSSTSEISKCSTVSSLHFQDQSMAISETTFIPFSLTFFANHIWNFLFLQYWQ